MQRRADALRLIRKAWDSKILLPELGGDSSGEEVIISTESFNITSPGGGDERKLEDKEHSKTVDGKGRKRKHAALGI
jgi:hypothetical protein